MKLASLMENYPKGSQKYTGYDQTMISVRLYDICHGTTWWLSEYDIETKKAYGYTKTIY